MALPAPGLSAAGGAAESLLDDGWKHPCFQLALLPMEKTSPGRGRKNRGSHLVKKDLGFYWGKKESKQKKTPKQTPPPTNKINQKTPKNPRANQTPLQIVPFLFQRCDDE